jgi:hypothetical protein
MFQAAILPARKSQTPKSSLQKVDVSVDVLAIFAPLCISFQSKCPRDAKNGREWVPYEKASFEKASERSELFLRQLSFEKASERSELFLRQLSFEKASSLRELSCEKASNVKDLTPFEQMKNVPKKNNLVTYLLF